jgi:hypothetical protein
MVGDQRGAEAADEVAEGRDVERIDLFDVDRDAVDAEILPERDEGRDDLVLELGRPEEGVVAVGPEARVRQVDPPVVGVDGRDDRPADGARRSDGRPAGSSPARPPRVGDREERDGRRRVAAT